MNVFGDRLGESQLVDWIAKYHRKSPPITECLMEHASVLISCLKIYGSQIAQNNDLIILPVNEAFITKAANLRCSLSRVGLRNVVYWALDLGVHDRLLAKGKLSIYLPGSQPDQNVYKPGDPWFIKMMHQKPRIIKMILEAGFNAWFMDADNIVIRNFANIVHHYTDASVFLGLRNTKHLLEGMPFNISTGIMYFRSNVDSITFLNHVEKKLDVSNLVDDQQAIQKVIDGSHLVNIKWKSSSVNQLEEESDTIDISEEAKLLHEQDKLVSKRDLNITNPICVRLLDQYLFIDGYLLFDHYDEIPHGYYSTHVVHLQHRKTPDYVLQEWGLYFMDEKGTCSQNIDPEALLYQKLASKAEWEI